jgi:hypothetical protein
MRSFFGNIVQLSGKRKSVLSFRPSLAILLAGHSIFALAPASAQNPVPAPEGQLAPPVVQSLKVTVLQGQHSVNDASRHIGVEPVVEVRDDNDRPVEGASVVFRLPPSGPGGMFDGKSYAKTARTNAQGQAGATTFIPNSQQGPFDIHVTAMLGSRMGQAVISQSNAENRLVMFPAKPKKKPLWLNKYVLIAAGAAVGAGVAIALTRGSGNKGVTITPGPVTINQ